LSAVRSGAFHRLTLEPREHVGHVDRIPSDDREALSLVIDDVFQRHGAPEAFPLTDEWTLPMWTTDGPTSPSDSFTNGRKARAMAICRLFLTTTVGFVPSDLI
jgi:hypothetical protein